MAQAAKDTLIAYIQENQERLYKMAYMYTRNQELALDVVQEAITKSLENLDIYQSLQKLEIKTRTVILLRFFENLKIEEIAKITHTNTNTVKSRLYKGLREMRKDMEKHYSEKIE